MKQTDPQFKLRLDEQLKAALSSSAKQNKRTLSAEIVARLQESFEQSALSQAAHTDIRAYAVANGITYQEALNALVASALMNPPIYYVSIDPGASLRDVSSSLKQLQAIAPNDATIMLERR